MRRITLFSWPALALAVGMSAVPASAPAQQNTDATPERAASCTRLIAPLEKRLREAEPRLGRVADTERREVVRSRLLFEVLSGEETKKSIALTLGCLATQRR